MNGPDMVVTLEVYYDPQNWGDLPETYLNRINTAPLRLRVGSTEREFPAGHVRVVEAIKNWGVHGGVNRFGLVLEASMSRPWPESFQGFELGDLSPLSAIDFDLERMSGHRELSPVPQSFSAGS